MSQNDVDNHDVSDDNGNADEKTVPVSEAIRYRKRAQQAEKQAAELAETLAQERQRIATLDQQLTAAQRQQTLRDALTAAGATDLEATMLLAQSRLEADGQADVSAVVEQLRSDKAHLFAAETGDAAPTKTAGLRHRTDGRGALDSAAARAARSGSRADMQEYLRTRRQFVN